MRKPACSCIVAVSALVLASCGSATGDTTGGDTAAGDPPGLAVVREVIDGDTVRVRIDGRDETVRMIGIDTPETHSPTRPVECYGRVAAEETARLLPEGTQVVLVRDVEARDRYDRLLAYVYRRTDDLFVNLDLAARGFAVTLTIPPNVAHAEEFATATRLAREQGLGLWAACGGADTPAA